MRDQSKTVAVVALAGIGAWFTFTGLWLVGVPALVGAAWLHGRGGR